MNDEAVSMLPMRRRIPDLTSAAIGHPLALALVAAGGFVANLMQARLGLREPALIFLTSVLVTAAVAGLGPSLLAVGLSVLVYNFYFTEPYHTFTINDPQDVLSIIVFLIVAVVTSGLMARVREQARVAREQEAQATSLHAFIRELSAISGLDEALAIVVQRIGEQFHADAILSLPEKGVLHTRAAHPADALLPDSEREARSFAWLQGRSAPSAVCAAANGRWVHVSLGTVRREVAVLSLDLRGPVTLSRESAQFLDSFTQQAGLGLERCLLAATHGSASAATDGEASTFETVLRARTLEERIGRLQEETLGLQADARELLAAASKAADVR